MMTNKPLNLVTFLSVIALILVATPSLADEIWVTPAVVPAEKEVGNWAVTDRGDTHFSFAVPNDLSVFAGAKVVLIRKEDMEITFDLSLSLSRDGLPHDVFTDAMADLGPEMLLKNQLREIDVSAIFPDFDPGMDYVTLHFRAKDRDHCRKKKHTNDRRRPKDIRIIGLRFQYDTDVFFDSTTGNVGIGTTAPGSELEVNGTVAARAFASTSPLILEAPQEPNGSALTTSPATSASAR
jgi:hypothetical protein